MFSFFSGKKVKIDAVTVPSLGWELQVDDAGKKLWVNPERTAALSLNFFAMKPDIPGLKDIDGLRAFYRKLAVDAKGGIVEVSVVDLKGFAAVRTILKVPAHPSGVSYLASLTLPFRDCSFVIKVQAVEAGTTGFRDTLVLDRLMESGVVKLRDDGLHGWMRDPYDAGFQEGKLMNLSELEEYDAEFPEHALSVARRVLGEVMEGVVLSEGLGRVARFS
jgi:hypothetical protein